LNKPITVMATNGATAMTPNSLDESPMSLAPRMFRKASAQIITNPTAHRMSGLLVSAF
jgi:hypothetical protein